jgi:tripartite-type tricarboxylate transporter receptor subunit TctC
MRRTDLAHSRILKTLGGLAGSFILAISCAHAQVDRYPGKAVTLVVPFPAGGGSDIAARHVATKLALDWKVPVVVANKPGAGSSIGSKLVADARPDGYTLLFTTSSLITSQYTNEGSPHVSAFAMVSVVAKTIPLLVVNADSGLHSFKDVARAGADASKPLTVGIVPGAYHEIMTEQFIEGGKLTVTRIPFKGHAESLVALAGGHIDAYMAPYAPVRSLIEAGKVRALAVASPARLAELPGVGTFREQGINFTSETFEAILAPKETPPAVLDALEAALKKALANEDTRSNMKAAGLIPAYLDRKQAEDLLHAQDREFFKTMTRLDLVKHRPQASN